MGFPREKLVLVGSMHLPPLSLVSTGTQRLELKTDFEVGVEIQV